MLELEENKRFLNDIKTKLFKIKETMNISFLCITLDNLKEEASKEGFWNNPEKTTQIFSKIKTIEKKIRSYTDLQVELSNLIELNELLTIEFDSELFDELLVSSQNLNKKINTLEVETYFSGKYDKNNAIITLHPGAGRNRITRLGTNVI